MYNLYRYGAPKHIPPLYIVENKFPLSSSNNSHKSGTAYSETRSGFSFSQAARFGPFSRAHDSLYQQSPDLPFIRFLIGDAFQHINDRKKHCIVRSFGICSPEDVCSDIFRAAPYCARENTIRSVGSRLSSSAGISTGSFPSALHTPKQASSPAGRLANQELPSCGSSGISRTVSGPDCCKGASAAFLHRHGQPAAIILARNMAAGIRSRKPDEPHGTF